MAVHVELEDLLTEHHRSSNSGKRLAYQQMHWNHLKNTLAKYVREAREEASRTGSPPDQVVCAEYYPLLEEAQRRGMSTSEYVI